MEYLLISNLYNEEENVEALFDTVEAQNLPPSLWLIVNDGSTDSTGVILARRQKMTRLNIEVWTGTRKEKPDYDSIGVSIKKALHSIPLADYEAFDYVCVLDADSRVGPDYFRELLLRMEANRDVGMASGTVWLDGGPERSRKDLARGSGRATRGEIWRSVQIDDLPDVVSDAFFNAKTKMMGFFSVRYPDLRVEEERPTTQMTLAGRRRRGRLMAIFWYNPLVLAFHCFSLALRGKNPVPMVAGYVEGLRGKRIDDEEVKEYFSRRMILDSLRHRNRGL
jgi:glycosyltransferase involved in cell wall biosynthesis